MSAKTSRAMDDSPNKNEAIAAPDTDRRPTRWVVLRGKSTGVTDPPRIARRACSHSLSSWTWSLYVGRRPTRWVVLRSRSKVQRFSGQGVTPLQLSGAARPLASPFTGRQRIHHQPGDGQGAHAAGNGRDSAGHLNGFAETHIAAEYVALLPQLGKLAGFGGKNAFTE